MGLLVANKYPTKLFLKAADHTYVECSMGGKAWNCWGGKTGGAPFNSGLGSTNRADCIAKPNERAGITCYLINGVCHQAANRILLTANILVAGARGYGVSSAIFGPYGKVGFWPCSAPFDQFPGISGDLPECQGAGPKGPGEPPFQAPTEAENKHLLDLQRAYASFDSQGATPLDSIKFQVDLFNREVVFRLGENLGEAAKGLRLAKETSELTHWQITDAFTHEQMSPVEFVKAFNAMTLKLQDDIASTIHPDQYTQLLGLGSDERVVLADPDIVAALYGKETAREAFAEFEY